MKTSCCGADLERYELDIIVNGEADGWGGHEDGFCREGFGCNATPSILDTINSQPAEQTLAQIAALATAAKRERTREQNLAYMLANPAIYGPRNA